MWQPDMSLSPELSVPGSPPVGHPLVNDLMTLRLKTESSHFFFNVCLFLRERESMTEKGQRERKTQNVKQAPGSELSARSSMGGSNLQTARSFMT